MASLIRSPFRVRVLAVGVCVVGATLAHLTLSDDPPPSPSATREPLPPVASSETAPPPSPSMEGVSSESAPAKRSAPQPVADSGDAVPTQLPFQLRGTLMSDDPGMSLAIVYEDTTQHSRTVWTGSTLQGAEVLAIERTRVLLSNKGRVEFLEISPRSAEPPGAASPAASAAPAPSPVAAPAALFATLQQTGPDTYVIQRSDVANLRDHAEELYSQGERKGDFRNGAWFGIKVVSLTPGSVYERMGLKAGDTLVKANELSLGMPPQEMRAVQLLKTAIRFDLDIERDGKMIRKTYFIQD